MAELTEVEISTTIYGLPQPFQNKPFPSRPLSQTACLEVDFEKGS
jgi:hypothetical protein